MFHQPQNCWTNKWKFHTHLPGLPVSADPCHVCFKRLEPFDVQNLFRKGWCLDGEWISAAKYIVVASVFQTNQWMLDTTYIYPFQTGALEETETWIRNTYTLDLHACMWVVYARKTCHKCLRSYLQIPISEHRDQIRLANSFWRIFLDKCLQTCTIFSRACWQKHWYCTW